MTGTGGDHHARSGGRIQQLVAGGDVTAPSPLTEPLRRFPVTGELTAAEAIEEDRAER